MAVWHPNDVNLATTAPDPSKSKAPETRRWTEPVCQDKPKPLEKPKIEAPKIVFAPLEESNDDPF